MATQEVEITLQFKRRATGESGASLTHEIQTKVEFFERWLRVKAHDPSLKLELVATEVISDDTQLFIDFEGNGDGTGTVAPDRGDQPGAVDGSTG